MTYTGYIARVEYNKSDSCLFGRVIGISDVIGFHGDLIQDMKTAFEEAVDDLETCQKMGRA